jgi:protein TonB
MSSDKFDKELAALYQQRKASIIEPYVDLQSDSRKGHYSPLKLISILIVAASASFGIMAIVGHFSELPSSEPKNHIITQVIELAELAEMRIPQSDKELVLPVKVLLPPKSDVTPPVTSTVLKPESTNRVAVTQLSMVGGLTINMHDLPPLTKPASLIEPTYKVLPKYSNYETQEGTVVLSYQVNELGKTININVLDSNVNRGLQRSAKKALAKWQYNPDTLTTNEFTIKFEFTKTEN